MSSEESIVGERDDVSFVFARLGVTRLTVSAEDEPLSMWRFAEMPRTCFPTACPMTTSSVRAHDRVDTVTRISLAAAGLLYALFAAECFRLAVEHGWERGVSMGEGSFVLVGAAAFCVAASRSRCHAPAVALGTLPLVGWFVATPWNSGRPFLVVSLIAPCIAACVLIRNGDRRARRA